jgi:ATP-dependent Clp protease protease subunit
MQDLGEAMRLQMQYPQYQRTREMTLRELLLENRIIFLAGYITEESARDAIMALLYLHSIKKEQDIHLYINSRGGYVEETLAIYDTMQFLTCDVATYCIGQAASGAAVILAAGAKGKRFALPNSRIMLHQPYGGVTGQAEDIRIQAEEILKAKRRINEILARHTGQSVEKMEQETERDRYMDPAEAKAYGLVDEILEHDPKIKK